MDVEKYNKYFKEQVLDDEEIRLYTEYIWEIVEEVNLQQDDHMYEREEIQEALDKDPTIFTKEEILKIKEADQFILDHIEDAARWFYFPRTYKKHPKKYWWRYAHLIASGEMPKPNLDEIFEKYLAKFEE